MKTGSHSTRQMFQPVPTPGVGEVGNFFGKISVTNDGLCVDRVFQSRSHVVGGRLQSVALESTQRSTKIGDFVDGGVHDTQVCPEHRQPKSRRWRQGW